MAQTKRRVQNHRIETHLTTFHDRHTNYQDLKRANISDRTNSHKPSSVLDRTSSRQEEDRETLFQSIIVVTISSMIAGNQTLNKERTNTKQNIIKRMVPTFQFASKDAGSRGWRRHCFRPQMLWWFGLFKFKEVNYHVNKCLYFCCLQKHTSVQIASQPGYGQLG